MRSSCVVQNIIKKRLSMFLQHRAAPDRWHLPATEQGAHAQHGPSHWRDKPKGSEVPFRRDGWQYNLDFLL